MAFQLYHSNGVLALLPLKNNQYNLVWSVNNNFFDYLMSITEEEFLKEVNGLLAESAQHKKSSFVAAPKINYLTSKRISFPLNTTNLENYVYSKVCFIGDSAHSIHPMIGQGLNLGLADVKAMGDVLKKNKDYGLALTNEINLLDFEKTTKINNYSSQAIVEFLKLSYGSSYLKEGRETVIGGLNEMDAVKSLLQRMVN